MLKAIAVIMGTIIGAGFASGKEIYNFFAQYGYYGIIGVVISGGLTGIIIYNTFKIANNYNIKNNIDFIKTIKGNSFLFKIVNIFLLVLFYIMIAGFSAFFKQEFNVPTYLTSAIFAILLYLALIHQIDGIVKINTIIVPILLLIITYIIIKYNISHKSEIIVRNTLGISLINAILYSSYNSILLIPILITLKKYINNTKKALIISIVISIILILLTLGISCILIKNNKELNNVDLPIISILNNRPEKNLYSVAIEIAIFTSALSAGYGVLENISDNTKNNKIKYRLIVGIMCIIGIPISTIGFGNLIGSLYPIFGMLGIIQIILILRKNIEKKDKN